MLSQTIARILLDQKAVTLSPDKPYTFASGIKSPIYCDNRVLISCPQAREVVLQGFETLLTEIEPVAVIAGTATAGIPWAAWLAQQQGKPLVYVRSANKAHGKGEQIEGRLVEDQSVVVIDDLITTGGSALSAVQVIKNMKCQVSHCLAIFSYNMQQAKTNFTSAGAKLLTLTQLDVLLDVAIEKSLITEAQKQLVLRWRDCPEGYQP
ncbi:MAG: Orotate phosphoribosyltransferase [uncultured bacterium]|nr:MAG: Orotate phosphoribosyltransferase [uncultured bacterium]